MRQETGITQTLSDHDQLMVLLVFRSAGLHSLLDERYPGKSFFNVLNPELDGYWKFFGRVDLGSTWFFHAPVPADTTQDNFDFHRFLHEAAGAGFDVELDHIGFWHLRFAIADSYRAGRAFIAGDAAHSHPPYGGYGVNSGLEDAVISRGNSPRYSKDGPSSGCLTAMTPRDDPSLRRRRETSSKKPSLAIASSFVRITRTATGPISKTLGSKGGLPPPRG